MTEDTEATLLEWVVQTSYRKGGESISVTEDVVSRETYDNDSAENSLMSFQPLPYI